MRKDGTASHNMHSLKQLHAMGPAVIDGPKHIAHIRRH